MKKNIIFVLFLITLIPMAYANINWFFEGNAEQGGIGGNKHTYFGSNLGTNLNESDISYERCNIEPSVFTPIATDFDGDGIRDIVVSRATTINIYDANCGLWNIINIGETIRAMPVLINHNADSNQEIAVLTANSIQIWEYSTGVGDFILIGNHTTALMPNADYMACDRGDDTVCILFKVGSRDTLKMNITSNIRTLNTNVLPYIADDNDAYSGLSFTDAYPNPKLTSFCWQRKNPSAFSSMTCTTIDINGNNVTSFDLDMPSTVGWITDVISWTTSGIINFNGQYRIFTGFDADTSTPGEGFYVHDLDGIEKMTASILGLQSYGNPMIGDYDKNGNVEFCITSNSVSDVILTCYDEDLSLTTGSQYNYTSIEPMDGDVMAEFYPQFNELCLANMGGIWCLNSSNNSQSIKMFDTGLVPTTGDNGHSMLFTSTGISLAYVYNDVDTSFIVRNTIVTNACGDNICQDFETSFSCPSDCLLEEELPNGFCSDSSTCPTQFPVCLFNECVALGTSGNATCSFDRDCPYDSPFCFNGICIADSQLSIPNTTGVTSDQATDRAFTNTIGILLGTSPLMKFMFGIGIVMGIIVLIASYTQSAVALMLSGFLALILTTVMGLVPIYVLILFVIGAVAFVILDKTVFSSPGGGGG